MKLCGSSIVCLQATSDFDKLIVSTATGEVFRVGADYDQRRASMLSTPDGSAPTPTSKGKKGDLMLRDEPDRVIAAHSFTGASLQSYMMTVSSTRITLWRATAFDAGSEIVGLKSTVMVGGTKPAPTFTCTSLSQTTPAAPLLAIGGTEGGVWIAKLVSSASSSGVLVTPLTEANLHDVEVCHVAFHPTRSDGLFVSIAADGSVAFSIVDGSTIRFAACAQLADGADGTAARVLATCWRSEGNSVLLLLTSGRLIELVAPPAAEVVQAGADAPELTPLYHGAIAIAAGEGVTATLVADPASGLEGGASVLLATSASGQLWRVSLRPCADLLTVADMAGAPNTGVAMSALTEVRANSQCISGVSMRGSHVASASASGECVLWEMDSTGALVALQTLEAHCGAVTAVTLAAGASDGSGPPSVISCGVDKSINVWSSARGAGSVGGDPTLTNAPALLRTEAFTPETQTPLMLQNERKAASLEMVHEQKRADMRVVVAGLKQRLDSLVAHNTACPELERMDREEFTIDLKGREMADIKSAKEQALMRKQAARARLEAQVISERIKAQFWDSMEVPPRSIYSFSGQQAVANMSLRKVSADEALQLRRLSQLRRLEKRASKLIHHKEDALRTAREKSSSRSKGEDDPTFALGHSRRAVDIVSKKTDFLVNAGVLTADGTALFEKMEMTSDGEKKAAAADATDDAADLHADDHHDDGPGEDDSLPQETLTSLMYPPHLCWTDRQKRIQISLLRALNIRLKKRFNEKFTEIFAKKESAMSRIAASNAAIKETQKKLGVPINVDEPRWLAAEQPEKVLEVTDEDIGFVRYISAAERKAIADKEEAERLRLLAEAGDDPQKRALIMMMNGTLAARNDLEILAASIHKPAWMEEEYNAEELDEKELEEKAHYEEQMAKLLEEQEKARKAHTLAVRKNRADVVDVVSAFDDQLGALLEERMTMQTVIYTQEMYVTQSVLALQRKMDLQVQMVQLSTRRAELRSLASAAAVRTLEEREIVLEQTRDRERMEERVRKMRGDHKKELQTYCDPRDYVAQMETVMALYSKDNEVFEEMVPTVAGAAVDSGFDQRRTSTMATMGPGGAGSVGDGTDGSGPSSAVLDPYASIDRLSLAEKTELGKKMLEESSLRQVTADDVDAVMQVDDELIQRVNLLRTQRIKLELEVGARAKVETEMSENLAEIMAIETEITDELSSVEATLGRAQALLGDLARNVVVVVRLRQGNDEIEQAPVVTDYGGAGMLCRRAELFFFSLSHTYLLTSSSSSSSSSLQWSSIVGSSTASTRLCERLVMRTSAFLTTCASSGSASTFWSGSTSAYGTGGGRSVCAVCVRYVMTALTHTRTILLLSLSLSFLPLPPPPPPPPPRSYEKEKQSHLKLFKTDLKILRVTKALQNFVHTKRKRGASDPHKEQAAREEKKLVHIEAAFRKKATKLKRQHEEVLEQITAKRNENQYLGDQRKGLTSTVSARKTIQESRSSGGGVAKKTSRTQGRMRAIRTRRKLIELAKSQTDEVDFLREVRASLSLSLLRVRSLPALPPSLLFLSVAHPSPFSLSLSLVCGCVCCAGAGAAAAADVPLVRPRHGRALMDLIHPLATITFSKQV